MKSQAPARSGWLRAAAECFPRLKLAGLEPLRGALDALGAEGSWQGGVGSAEGFKRAALRYAGARGDFGRWARAAAAALGRELEEGVQVPPKGFPWLELVWNAETGALGGASLFCADWRQPRPGRAVRLLWEGAASPRQAALTRARFSPELFEELGLAGAFRDFARLCPVDGLISESCVGAAGVVEPRNVWALALAEPISWPALLRLDVSAPFSAASAQSSFILLDREVVELGFTQESMWVWFLD